MCDTTVHGYDVPKGTLVIVNLWAVMHDPQLWDNPQELMPERFLDEHGQLKPIPKAWMPFSTGRRNCLGESVAKPELLLVLSCLLKRFTFSFPEGTTFDPAMMSGDENSDSGESDSDSTGSVVDENVTLDDSLRAPPAVVDDVDIAEDVTTEQFVEFLMTDWHDDFPATH
ncbi:hypothetical protein ACOMHN_019818 [Nucella lapillus]